ncbi:TonB-dependent siderophore receptor [Acinetobacter puyangensis]|uniref:TonB-dependent siderophore receptor n=1 Tax=Acinetobacter puyangensis TaxID=1096779 RepID=UPI003A4E2E47
MNGSSALSRFNRLFLAIAAVTASVAHAEETSSVQTLPVITVEAEDDTSVTEGTGSYTAKSTNTATKLNLSLRETPQSVKVLTREYLDDTNTNTLQQMLGNLTGVTINQFDERVYPTARGFDVDYFLYDGVPSSSSIEMDNATDPDLSMYDRIEVVKGANGLTTGAGNPAVAINMIRKHANAKELTGSVSTSFGSWGAWSSTADVSNALNADGSIRGRVLVKHEQSGSSEDRFDKENNLIYAVLDADLTDSTYVSFGAGYQDLQRQGIKWGGLTAFYSDGTRTNFDRGLTVSDDWTYWNNQTTTAFATLKQKLFNDITLNVDYSYRRLDTDTALLYPWVNAGVDKETNTASGYYAYSSNGTFLQNTADAYVSLPFTLGDLEQQIIAGISFDQSERTNAYYGNPTLASSLIDYNNIDAKLIGSINNPNVNPSNRTIQRSAYLAGKFKLFDPLKLIAGVRLTNWKFNSADGAGNREYNGKISPYAGLIYDLNDQYSWYASYTGVFRPDDKKDINQQYIDPREGKSYETGIKGEFLEGKLNAAIGVFQTKLENFAETTGTTITTADGLQTVYRATEVESKGVELELDGKLTDRWNLSLGVSHFNAKNPTGQRVQTTAARTNVNLFTKYQLDKLSIGGGVNYKSKTYTTDPNFGLINQDAYVLANLMLGYDLTENIKAQININNLFDEKYYDGLGQNGMIYGEPRNATLTLRYNF